MRCAACGFEKLGETMVEVPKQTVYYTRGPKAGEVKFVKPATFELKDLDPEKPEFIRLGVEKGFGFRRVLDFGFARWVDINLYACPKCSTVRIEGAE
jgi:CRISPR/Cas system endoribonuclease Cas6 (RAMP superfamily)